MPSCVFRSVLHSPYRHTRPEAPGYLLTSLNIERPDSARLRNRARPYRNRRVDQGQIAMACSHRYHRLGRTWALQIHRGILAICFKKRLPPLKWIQFAWGREHTSKAHLQDKMRVIIARARACVCALCVCLFVACACVCVCVPQRVMVRGSDHYVSYTVCDGHFRPEENYRSLHSPIQAPIHQFIHAPM